MFRKLLQNQSYTWLITGVAGFIGSNLLEHLLKLNQKVIGLDNFSTGYKHNLDEVLQSVSHAQKENFTFYQGDICNIEDCRRAAEGVDYVLHQAALASVPCSLKYPERTHAVNVTGFLNMLMAAQDKKVRRFVYASSSSVYGDSQTLAQVENDIGKPLSPYAATKYIDECYASVFANCYGIETIGLRYFNVFGPRQDPNGAYAAVIPLWVSALLHNKPIYIYGDGETSRDFTYVDNVVQANLLAATVQNKRALNQVYNIAMGERTTLNQLYTFIRDIFKAPTSVKPIYKDFRKGDVRHSLADIDKAKDFLGYVPEYNLSDGLLIAKDWYKK